MFFQITFILLLLCAAIRCELGIIDVTSTDGSDFDNTQTHTLTETMPDVVTTFVPLTNRNAMTLFFRGHSANNFANKTVLARNAQLPMPFSRKRLMIEEADMKKRLGPVARNLGNLNSAALPCCRDRFGEAACQSLRKTQPATFEKRCLADHDFHTIDCCSECRKYIENNNIHMDNARAVLKAPIVCRDKHSISFCRRFKESGLGKYSCKDTEFAIRVCRSSCGYCNDELYSASNTVPSCSSLNARFFHQYANRLLIF